MQIVHFRSSQCSIVKASINRLVHVIGRYTRNVKRTLVLVFQPVATLQQMASHQNAIGVIANHITHVSLSPPTTIDDTKN